MNPAEKSNSHMHKNLALQYMSSTVRNTGAESETRQTSSTARNTGADTKNERVIWLWLSLKPNSVNQKCMHTHVAVAF